MIFFKWHSNFYFLSQEFITVGIFEIFSFSVVASKTVNSTLCMTQRVADTTESTSNSNILLKKLYGKTLHNGPEEDVDENTEIKILLDFPPLQLKSYFVAKCVQLLKGSVQKN